jgi:hypothetical protein
MKNGRITLIALVILTATLLTAFTATQDNNSSTIIVKATATVQGKNFSFIRIYRENSEVEKIELQRLTGGVEAEENNFKAIISTLNKLNKEGYEVVSSTELGTSNGNVSTFVLRK